MFFFRLQGLGGADGTERPPPPPPPAQPPQCSAGTRPSAPVSAQRITRKQADKLGKMQVAKRAVGEPLESR